MRAPTWWADVNRRLDRWLATRGGHITFDPPPRPEPDRTNPWATNEWHRTLVTPLFVGGPYDGEKDDPRPRHELMLRFQVPLLDGPNEVRWRDLNDPHVERLFAFDAYVYQLGPYVDAFTVEYR